MQAGPPGRLSHWLSGAIEGSVNLGRAWGQEEPRPDKSAPCCAAIEHSGFLKLQQADTEAGPTVCPFR